MALTDRSGSRAKKAPLLRESVESTLREGVERGSETNRRAKRRRKRRGDVSSF